MFAGQRQGEQPGPVARDDQHRAIPALSVVLLEEHPGPDDLAGAGSVTPAGVARVRDGGRPEQVSGIRLSGWPKSNPVQHRPHEACEVNFATDPPWKPSGHSSLISTHELLCRAGGSR